MADEAVSGQYAVINGIPSVMNWSVQRSRPSNATRHSGTRGGKYRNKGVGSWQGSWSAKGPVPAVMPGQSFSFLGYGGPSDGTAGANGYRYSGTAIVTDVTIAWDYASNKIVDYQLNFVGHLGLTRSSGVAIEDTSTEVQIEPILCPMKWNDVALTDMVSAQLKIMADVPSYVNSSTNNETGRRASSMIDWEAQFVIQRTDNTIAEGDLQILKMYTSATEFYSLKWGIAREYGGITANRETGEIISQTLTIEMASNNAAGTVGEIIMPDLSTYWPTY